MGESVVEAPNIKNQMGESVASHPTLEVSISFGKFENDSLSWEKWSTFSPNKYLEEVGKCSTPGSVAQKKAYFEAHYKKIAAKKAELLDQEKSVETDQSRSGNDRNCKDHNESSSEEVEQESKLNSVVNVECQSSKLEGCNEILLNGEAHDHEYNYQEEATSVKEESYLSGYQDMGEQPSQVEYALESESSLVSDSTEALNGKQDNDEFSTSEEVSLVNDGMLEMVKNQPLHIDVESGNNMESKEEISKLPSKKMSQKVNPTRLKQDFSGMKKKQPISPIAKSPITPAPRLSKPKPTSTPLSAPTFVIKKANTSRLPSKNPSIRESKKAAPAALHLSLSLTSVNSDSVSVTTLRRKSLIMEQMGDKDIVKRAFRAFQNNYNQLSTGDGKYSGSKQVPKKGLDQKTSSPMTPRKENERARKTAEIINAQRGPLGTKSYSVSSGPLKRAGINERRVNAASFSVGLRSDERAERRKEFLKNLTEKSNAREAEKTRLGSKSKEAKEAEKTRPISNLKEEKEAEMKKLRQSLNFKAKPMPGFYRAQGMSKSPSGKFMNKDIAKNEIHRQPDSHPVNINLSSSEHHEFPVAVINP